MNDKKRIEKLVKKLKKANKKIDELNEVLAANSEAFTSVINEQQDRIKGLTEILGHILSSAEIETVEVKINEDDENDVMLKVGFGDDTGIVFHDFNESADVTLMKNQLATAVLAHVFKDARILNALNRQLDEYAEQLVSDFENSRDAEQDFDVVEETEDDIPESVSEETADDSKNENDESKKSAKTKNKKGE